MKKLFAMILAAALVLSLAACGGSSAPAATTAATEAPAETAAPAETEAAAEVTEAAETEAAAEEASFTTITAGVLTMSTNAAFPPYEMTTDEGGFAGIDVEIAGAIAEKLVLTLQIDDMDFDAALLAAQQGKSDIIMAGVTVTDERLMVMEFSNSYATGTQVVIVPEGSDITLDTLGEHMIGVQRATTGEIYCESDYGADHITSYDNGMMAVMALTNGQVDCVVIDSAPAANFVTSNPGLTILDTEYVTEDYAIGMAKGNLALKAAIDNALAELTADGTIQAIIDKYIAA